MVAADWLMGAWENAPAFAFTVNGIAKSIAADNWWLWDATSGISLLTQLQSKIQEEVASATVTIRRNGKIRITVSAALTLTWDSDTTLRDALGFTGTVSTSTTADATNHTRYLWRSGTTYSPEDAPLDSLGAPAGDDVYADFAGGVIRVGHNNWRELSFRFGYVDNAKFQTAAEASGEFVSFWQDVIRRAYRFKIYRLVEEDETTTVATLTGLTVLGPYKVSSQRDGAPFPHRRSPGFELQDFWNTVRLEARTVPELT